VRSRHLHFAQEREAFLGFPTIRRSRNWLKELAVEVSDTGIQKLVPRLQKYLDLDGDYVEK
jgi:hypothetical protein